MKLKDSWDVASVAVFVALCIAAVAAGIWQTHKRQHDNAQTVETTCEGR